MREALKRPVLLFLLVASACSVQPRQSELDLMISDADLQALCGPAAGRVEIEAETLPLRMRKVSTSLQDDECGISLNYRLYTYSTEGGATNKFREYEATYDAMFDGFDKVVADDGQRIRYLRNDAQALVFLSKGGSSLISGSARSSAENIQRLARIVLTHSEGLIDQDWGEQANDSL